MLAELIINHTPSLAYNSRNIWCILIWGSITATCNKQLSSINFCFVLRSNKAKRKWENKKHLSESTNSPFHWLMPVRWWLERLDELPVFLQATDDRGLDQTKRGHLRTIPFRCDFSFEFFSSFVDDNSTEDDCVYVFISETNWAE